MRDQSKHDQNLQYFLENRQTTPPPSQEEIESFKKMFPNLLTTDDEKEMSYMENEQLELLEKPAKVNVFIPLMKTTQVTEDRNLEDEIITMKVRPKMDYNMTFYNIDDSSLSADQMSRKFHSALTKALNAFHQVMDEEMNNSTTPPPKPVPSPPRTSKYY